MHFCRPACSCGSARRHRAGPNWPAHTHHHAGSDGTDTSKKRPIEEVVANATSQIQESVNKRAHLGGIEFGKEYAIKLLVANKDAGTVIGRSGATIQAIQAKTGCRVRVSNNNDFFPGTDQRVVLVTGPADSVSAGVIMIMSELFENAEEIQKNGGLVAESVAVCVCLSASVCVCACM